MKIIYCATLRDYFEKRNDLISKGLIEIKSVVYPCRGENWIKVDGVFFALTSKPE